MTHVAPTPAADASALASAQPAPILALVYDDGPTAEAVIRRVVRLVEATGLSVAGLIQRDIPRPDRRRCDMILEDLGSGTRIPISEDRGPEARGCHLDLDALGRASLMVEDAIRAGADLAILNKFGKEEAEGRGFRAVIALALEHAVPLMIGVPRRNLEAFRTFADGLAEETAPDEATVLRWLALALPGPQAG